jgi:hypothetical protein
MVKWEQKALSNERVNDENGYKRKKMERRRWERIYTIFVSYNAISRCGWHRNRKPTLLSPKAKVTKSRLRVGIRRGRRGGRL